jgi:hypothetical protein
MEVKRHFDDTRRRGITNHNVMAQANGILGLSMAESVPLTNAPVRGPKEIAILTYRDSTEQLVTESMLSKVLEKRKNDPFW